MTPDSDRLGIEYCGAVLSDDQTHVEALRATVPNEKLLDALQAGVRLLGSHLANLTGHRVDELGHDLMMVAQAESACPPE
jgi:CobQ-like glutamine amidotransferase family enzyme